MPATEQQQEAADGKLLCCDGTKGLMALQGTDVVMAPKGMSDVQLDPSMQQHKFHLNGEMEAGYAFRGVMEGCAFL